MGDGVAAVDGADRPDEAPIVLKPEAHLGWLVAGDIAPLWLEQLERRADAAVVIDLGGVTGIDSDGLGSLVDLVEAARGGGDRGVTVLAGSAEVANLLRLVSLDLLCRIVPADGAG